MEKAAWRNEFLLTEGTCVPISVLPTVLLNALVIFAVITRRYLRNKATILLACLAGADLLTGLVGQPIRVAAEVQRILKRGTFCSPLERVRTLSLIWHMFATLTHLVLITTDRYIAIKKPLRYREIVSTRRIRVAELSVWTFAIFVVISEVILSAVNGGENMYNIYLTIWDLVLITVTSISIIPIVGMYSYIFSETRRQQRSQTEHLSAEEIATIRRNNRATRTLGSVLGTLLATYLPTIIFIIMYYSVNVERRVLNCIASWVATLTMLGALCNPAVYCWRNEEFRQAFLQILHLTSPENNQPQEAIEMQVIQPAYSHKNKQNDFLVHSSHLFN